MSFFSLLRGVLLLLTLSAVIYLFNRFHVAEMLDMTWMDQWVKGHGIQGELIFLLLGSIVTAAGLPRQIVAIMAGYSFGIVLGVVLSVFAMTIGAALAFFYARWLARSLVSNMFSRQVEHLNHFTRDAPFYKTIAIRLLPVGNNLLTCLIAGVSTIAATPFLLGSAVGYVPQALIFAIAGDGVKVNPEVQLTVSVVLFIVFGVLAIIWYRGLRAGQMKDIDSISQASKTQDDDSIADGA